MGENGLLHLKSYVQDYLSKRMPGMLSFLNMLCFINHGSDCVSLLFKSPSKLYLLLLNQYRFDTATADYAFTLMFINPIVGYLRKPELAQHLLELVKSGRDADFTRLLKTHLTGGTSA